MGINYLGNLVVTERAALTENDWFIWLWGIDLPWVYLDSTFTTIEADGIRIFKYDKLLLELHIWSFSNLWKAICSSGRIVILIPIIVYPFRIELLEAISAIKEADSHVVRKDKDVAKNVIVIVIPDILVGKLQHRLLRFDINNLKAFMLQVSYC